MFHHALLKWVFPAKNPNETCGLSVTSRIIVPGELSLHELIFRFALYHVNTTVDGEGGGSFSLVHVSKWHLQQTTLRRSITGVLPIPNKAKLQVSARRPATALESRIWLNEQGFCWKRVHSIPQSVESNLCTRPMLGIVASHIQQDLIDRWDLSLRARHK